MKAQRLTAQSYSKYLTPIETPLVFNGFSNDTVQRYASQFAAEGIVPVMGIGSASNRKQPEPIEAGSAVSAVLVRGDMDIAATCTVTYVIRSACWPADIRFCSLAMSTCR